jgi:hypothetical protein
MALKWADELSCSEPLQLLEPFYILAALELGDPDGAPRWLEHNAAEFHALYRKYRANSDNEALPRDSAEVLVQYLVWYPRESARLLSGKR